MSWRVFACRWRTLAAALALPACAAESPLADGPVGAEDAALIAIATAFQAGDCARVESLAAGFVASSDLRLHAVTTWYGRCRFKADDDPGAVALLERVAYVEPAASSDPWIPTALYWLGRARLGAGDAATAVADFARFRERFAHDGLLDDATYYLGKAHLDAGDPTAAIATFATLLAMPEASELRRAGATYTTGLAFIDLAAGDPASPALDTAFDWLERLRGEFATSIYADNAAYRQGRIRYDQGRFAPAIEAFASNLTDPASAYHDNALYYTGRSWYRLASADDPERFERAIIFFERVLAEHPDSIYADDAAYFAARAAYELEDLEAAEVAFALLPARFPTSPYVDNAWHYLVLLRVALGDCPGAVEALSALSRITPPSDYTRSTETFFAASACADATP